MTDTYHDDETQTLRRRLAEAEDMLRAIRQGEIDALVVEGQSGSQVYTLHSAEEPYRNLVEQMQEGAVVLNRDGHILYCNTRFAALVGESLETVVGSRVGRFVDMSDRDDFDRLLGMGSGKCRSSFVGHFALLRARFIAGKPLGHRPVDPEKIPYKERHGGTIADRWGKLNLQKTRQVVKSNR